jgi:hypothetical protein
MKLMGPEAGLVPRFLVRGSVNEIPRISHFVNLTHLYFKKPLNQAITNFWA